MTSANSQQLVCNGIERGFHSAEPGSVPGSALEITTRIAIVISHPIQYYAPYYRALAATSGVELKVFFCCRMGVDSYYDRDFKTTVKWDIPLLEGYDSEFLSSSKEIKLDTFWAMDNPDVGQALERFHPDVVEISGYAHRTIWRVVGWCNQNRVPVVMSSDSNGTAKRAMWKRIAKAVIVKRFYRNLDGALTTGDNNRAYHLNYGIPPERLFARVLPVDCKHMVTSVGDADAARRDIRKQHGIPEDAFVIVFAGKLSAMKCPLHLLEAVHKCARDGLKVWGLLVGEGAQRPILEAFIAKHQMKNVVLTGFVNQSSIGRYYAASEVVTLMSQYEPKGQTVPEAGSLGCPAILSDRVGCIGPSDSARPGENALVYPWSDIDAFVSCITRIYKGPSLYRSMSEAAIRIANMQDASVAAVQMKDAALQVRKLGSRK